MSSNNNTDSEAFTHPQLYREYINHPSKSDNKKKEATALNNKSNQDKKSASTTAGSDDEWDLYPKLVRDIENHGTPEQVEHLHQLERTPSQH
ncbi:hypothetical protein BJ944DRAFT_260083 [Cunninghamella echinulata]|nr:hypothetical protein BJ944DRAFT_260083 [Cunninghamella echinulata]